MTPLGVFIIAQTVTNVALAIYVIITGRRLRLIEGRRNSLADLVRTVDGLTQIVAALQASSPSPE